MTTTLVLNLTKHHFHKITVSILTFSLLSCAVQQPTQDELLNADYGTYPLDYKELIENYMEDSLFDPYSAVYSDWRPPSEGWSVMGYGGERAFGYRVCVNINAKNRMGAYVGKQAHYYLIYYDNVVQTTSEEFLVQQLCNF